MALANTRVILAAVIVIIVIAAGFYMLFFRQQAANVVVIGTTDDVTELDPATSYDFFTWEVLSNVMAGLVTYDQQGNIVPYLAESWESQMVGRFGYSI
nr:hypothetical protein [Aeropyrum camini]